MKTVLQSAAGTALALLAFAAWLERGETIRRLVGLLRVERSQ